MRAAGHSFWRADNGVWLTDAVPAEFLEADETTANLPPDNGKASSTLPDDLQD
jgi:RNA:NAD 2'-phosphotransferase (TPT1/KptA family)